MEFTAEIEQARAAHASLRRRAKPFESDDQKLTHLQEIRAAFDQLWPATGKHPEGAHIRQSIRRLRADAELHAGFGEQNQVFSDDESVWKEYDFLKRMFAGPTAS